MKIQREAICGHLIVSFDQHIVSFDQHIIQNRRIENTWQHCCCQFPGRLPLLQYLFSYYKLNRDLKFGKTQNSDWGSHQESPNLRRPSVYENQYGFSPGGRIEHCLFVLDYIANMTFESSRNKSLFFAFIDFKKAYDSINRKKLIEVMVRFKINPQIY